MGNVTNFGNKLFASKCVSEARYICFKVTESSYQIRAYKNVFFSDFDEQGYKIEKHNGERAFLLWGKIIFSVAQVAKTTKGGQLQRIRHCNDAVIIIDTIIIRVRKGKNFPDSKIFAAKPFQKKPVNCISFQIRDTYV